MKTVIRFAILSSLFFSILHSACSTYKESFIINEINTWNNWVELYRNPKNPPPNTFLNWSVKVCSKNRSNTCETKPFNYNFYTDGSFPVIQFSNGIIPSNESVEILIRDSSGNTVDYWNIKQGNNPVSNVMKLDADACSFNATNTPCKYSYSPNSGQRDIARIPDGSCTYTEYTGNTDDSNTKNSCNSCNISPTMNTCWVENFANPDISKNWTIIKQQNYTPQVVNGKLMLTNKSAQVATGMTLGGYLPAANNFFVIEFEQNAYNGTGADGITLTLSDATVTPVAGAFGGSLGYAQKSNPGSDCTVPGGCPGFAGGWLGIGIDEYGNFSNPSEGRIGGPGQRQDSVAIRGAGSGITGYPYIAGTSTLNPGIDTGLSTPSPSHLYRLSVNTYNSQTWVKVERNTGSGYATIINWADATQIASSPLNYRLSLTGSTGGSVNYHSVDNFTLTAVDCGTIGQAVTAPTYRFDAWDTFRSINDRNISTKIVGKDFNLTIGSLNDSNNGTKDFNGTVCAQIVNSAGNPISGWSAPALFNNEQTKTLTFNLNRAIGGSDSAGIKLYWKKNVSSACPISTEDNSTIATDRFAVRPASFDLSAPNAIAGADFNVTFRALNQIGTASSDYNETSSGTFDVQIAERNPVCPLGTFTAPLTPLTFQNGSKTLTTRYSDVGLIDINITDMDKPCISRYAAIDCDDLNVSDGSAFTADLIPIGHKSASIVIKPHHFDYDARLQNFNALNYTYLSNDLNMSAKLDLNITARGADNLTTPNYNALCYAKNTNYTFNYFTAPSISSSLQYVTDRPDPYTQVFGIGTFGINDINRSVFTTDHNGTAVFEVSLNFTRSPSLPLSPFDMNISSALVQDTDGISGNDATIGNATFVYGRTRAYDITTDQTTVPNPVEMEIYGKNPTHSFLNDKPQNILYWYRNTDHNTNASGSVLSASASDLTFDTSSSPSNGLHTIMITNPFGSAMTRNVNIAIPEWLWYSPSGTAYDGTGTDCSKHPCFVYRFIPNASSADQLREDTKGVNSGTFGGGDFSIPSSESKTNRGSKMFR